MKNGDYILVHEEFESVYEGRVYKTKESNKWTVNQNRVATGNSELFDSDDIEKYSYIIFAEIKDMGINKGTHANYTFNKFTTHHHKGIMVDIKKVTEYLINEDIDLDNLESITNLKWLGYPYDESRARDYELSHGTYPLVRVSSDVNRDLQNIDLTNRTVKSYKIFKKDDPETFAFLL